MSCVQNDFERAGLCLAKFETKRNAFFSASFLEMGGLKAFDSPQGNSSTLEIFCVCRKASCQKYLSLPPSGSFCLFPNTCFQIRKNCTISSYHRFFSRPVTNLFQLFQRIDRGFLKVFYYLKWTLLRIIPGTIVDFLTFYVNVCCEIHCYHVRRKYWSCR